MQNLNGTDPQISVIIPCYNNAQHIGRTLKSVLAQTIKDFEIIIINDASPDWNKTLPVIKAFNDDRIKIISHKKNKNGAAARNTGIKAAPGKYIAFLDADDEWLPNHLEDSVAFLNETNTTLSYCRSIIKTNNFKDLTLPSEGIKVNEKIGNYLFCNEGFIPTSTFVYIKELVPVLFNPQLKRHQDYDFLLKAEAVGCTIAMSPHTGAIVHWENNNPASKGGTWKYSLNWAAQYKSYLSNKAYANFIYKNVVVPLLKNNERTMAMKLFIFRRCFFYLPLKQWLFFISFFIFGKIIFNRIKK